ncbi:EamA family transporter [Nostocaceae cyanobacterium CENA369]|uniref:EamA family transporter n=1 Tax=Dendronalium phyllosphericum CENA369 TaxID=1725256 RepID=A0A8J7I3S3_9NOST|nr:DMT family transporter [Dendronalium phyllosphericum]MBH8575340.1 EamA family transporter [Dendronalium phyllosphericum CENA369]
MGRFEKRPDNPRVRGELSRSAETALWAIVEDLEHLQQNVLKSLQEEIKRLQMEKDRLANEIQQLTEEKEHLQHVRQITEQQVLIRQLAEALAKHISSQLQSSLRTIANQAIESEFQERTGLKSAEISKDISEQNNENAERLLGTLDDTLTIAFNSLQQELKNYQSDISQQLSRMYSQQQQGEAILEELTNHLQSSLAKTITETSQAAIQPSLPTVLQPPEPQPESPPNPYPLLAEVTKSPKVSPQTVLQPPEQQIDSTSESSSAVTNKAQTPPPTVLQPPEQQPESSPNTFERLGETTRNTDEPISVIPKDSSENVTEASPNPFALPETEIAPPTQENTSEPISVISQDKSIETTSQPATEKVIESISTTPKEEIKSSSTRRNSREPISVLGRDSSKSNTKSPPPTPAPRRGSTFPPRSRPSSGLSPVQIGFLLVVLSTVVSSLYNVALKQMFFKAIDNLGVLEVEGLISPTLGNIFLILTLRLMVVVPLMVLLAPIMYPQVWQDLQSLMGTVRGNSTAGNPKTQQKTLQLSIASGCFLFLSQVLIYLAIGQMAAGMAIALFFAYPLFSGLLSWLLFRDRPNSFRFAAIGSIFCGELLVLGGSLSTGIDNLPLLGSTALFAGVAFACYVILTRMCATKVHPVSFTLVNFSTMLVLSFIGLMLPLPESWNLVVDRSKLLEIVLSAAILGVLTLSGHVFNHLGIHKLGASKAAIVGAGVPILTVIFAGLMIQETLDIVQILGVLFVTFGVAAFSLEKMRSQAKSSSSEQVTGDTE